jgi:hypothetical protein
VADRLLIERAALLDHTAKYGLSAIMLAVVNGHVEIVRLLAQACADLALHGSGAPGFHDKTALDLAEARGADATNLNKADQIDLAGQLFGSMTRTSTGPMLFELARCKDR